MTLFKKKRKSQAAIEFLLTYGWAILAVLVAIGALAYFGVLDPANFFPDTCVFSTGLVCEHQSLGADGIKLNMKNYLHKDIIIDGISAKANGNDLGCTYSPFSEIWESGQTMDLMFSCDINNSGLMPNKKAKVFIDLIYHPEGLTGYPAHVTGEIFTTLSDMPINSIMLNGKNMKLEIFNQTVDTYYNLYNGHASHYLWWPLYLNQDIYYVDVETGEPALQLNSPASVGTAQYRLVKCLDDGSYSGCTADLSKGCFGNVKDYGEKEDYSYVFDDAFHNCISGNPWVGIFSPAWNSGNQLRMYMEYMQMTGYGKYQVCVRYRHNSGIVTEPKCTEFIADYLVMDKPNVNPTYNFGDTISYTFTNPRSGYDGSSPQTLDRFYTHCYLYQWPFQHNPASDNGASVALYRHGTWSNYWAYIGVKFGISSSQAAGDREMTVEFKMPSTCFLRDRDGDSDYSFHLPNCYWFHGVNGQDGTYYCCSDAWSTSGSANCDRITVSGQNGGTLTITDYVDPKGDNSDQWDIYIECPGGTAFTNEADPFSFRAISGVDYFWINDMDYSAEKTFSEALPDQRHVNPSATMDCTNMKLNFCGRANTLTYYVRPYDTYFGDYTSPSTICVRGAQCPHVTC